MEEKLVLNHSRGVRMRKKKQDTGELRPDTELKNCEIVKFQYLMRS